MSSSNPAVKKLVLKRPPITPYIPAPAGTHIGNITSIEMVNEPDNHKPDKPMTDFVCFRLALDTPEGSFNVRKKYRLSWYETSNLFKLLTAFGYSPNVDDDIEISSLVGRTVLVSVTQFTAQNGNTYANVEQILPVPVTNSPVKQVPALSDEEAEEAEIEEMVKNMTVKPNKPIENISQNESSSDVGNIFDEDEEEEDY